MIPCSILTLTIRSNATEACDNRHEKAHESLIKLTLIVSNMQFSRNPSLQNFAIFLYVLPHQSILG